VLFKDDASVVEVKASKHYAPERTAPCVLVTVRDAAPPPAIEALLFEMEAAP